MKPTPPVPLCSEAQAGPSGVPDTCMNWETQASVLRFYFYSFLQPVECRNDVFLVKTIVVARGLSRRHLVEGPAAAAPSLAPHPLRILAGEFHGLCSPRGHRVGQD